MMIIRRTLVAVKNETKMNVISEKEYSFSNALFWNVMLHHHIQAFDEERDVNFDEVWDEELVLTLLDKKKYKKYWCWLSQIDLKTSENQGEIENPRTLTLPIGSDIVLTIEFHHIIDVTDVVTTDIPEFDVVVAGDTGCFQKVEVFAEDDVSGVGTVDYKAPLQDFRVLCRKLLDFQ